MIGQRRQLSAIPAWHQRFLAHLPKIRSHAAIVFRDLKPEARQEAIQEVIANALVAYARLVERNSTHLAFPTVLAGYAAAQFREGRRVGTKANCKDVCSPIVQKQRTIYVERLDHYDEETQEWQESVVEDHRTPVPDQAAFRIDFPAWLKSYPKRDRRIAEALLRGESTNEVARKFKISPGRISQLRKEFHHSWEIYRGEAVAPAAYSPVRFEGRQGDA